MNTTAHRMDAALLVIDIQGRLADAMRHRARVIERTRLLVKVAVIVGVPIIATRQYPRGLGDLCPEVEEVLHEAEQTGASVKRVDKLAFDCFAEQPFVEVVETTLRRQLVVVGMESHICVCQTTLSGLRAGYDVHVATDACCSRDDENHASSLLRLAGAGAVMSTAESVAYELVGRAGTDEFKRLLAAVKAAATS